MDKVKKNYADMDPIEELRAIREELSREFPTMKAFGDYLRANFPLAKPAATPEPQPKSRRASARPKTRANIRPATSLRKTTAQV